MVSLAFSAFLSSMLSHGPRTSSCARSFMVLNVACLGASSRGGNQGFLQFRGETTGRYRRERLWCYGRTRASNCICRRRFRHAVARNPLRRAEVAGGGAHRRRERGTSGVVDGSVCHGSLRSAHLFNRLRNYYGVSAPGGVGARSGSTRPGRTPVGRCRYL